MFCDPLDIPDEIIAAQEAGELVVFVGAGVSCGGTSGLPLFEGLTDLIGETIGKSREGRKDFDSILGEWHELNEAKVHQVAQRIIDNPASKPNEAHSLLLKLFRKSEDIRIVTTNYDRHFSTAAKELGFELPHYRAPALPLGDDFHGIVYLHGGIDDKAERLILTDADFGRAYLSQGWARTFLQALYARFHVLFVGYSHADTLLTYLARGLPTKDSQRRYAIQEVGDQRKWRQLGINVVPYPLSDEAGDLHSNLTLGLRRWVQLSNYRPQDVRERIQRIVDGFEATQLVVGETGATTSNELSRADEDFLRKALQERSSVRWFVERAKDFRWIAIVHKLGVLPKLSWDIGTENDRNLRDINPVLIWWATTGLISRTNADALESFALLGGKFGAQASWRLLATLLKEDPTSSSAWKSPFLDYWLTALRHGTRDRSDDALLSALIAKLALHGYVEQSVGLFGQLLRVRMEFTRQLSFREEQFPILPTPILTSNVYSLESAWKAVQSLRTPPVDDRLWRMLVGCVEELYAVYGPIGDGYDPIAGLGIIFDEPKETDRLQDIKGLVGEMLLSILRSKGTSQYGIDEAQIHSWLDTELPGWQRFAYFALKVASNITAARKAEIILQRSLIYPNSWQLQHDPSSLVAAIFGELNLTTKRKFLKVIGAGPKLAITPERTPEEHTQNQIQLRNGFLYRLATAHPKEPIIFKSLIKYGLQPPTVGISVGADADDFNGFAHDVEQSPRTVDEILKEPAPSQIEFFLTYQGEGNSWRGPNRGGLLGAVASAANTDMSWARALIESLSQRGVFTGDIWERLSWNLEWHVKDPEFRKWFTSDILPQLPITGKTRQDWNGWTHFILKVAKGASGNDLSPEEWDSVLTWSLGVWEMVKFKEAQDDLNISGLNLLSKAINDPIGHVLEFWARYLDHYRRSNPSATYDWPAALKPRIQELVETSGMARCLGLAIVGQFLGFLRYAVPTWVQDEIYPRLDMTASPEMARPLWETWLVYGQITTETAKDMPPLMLREHVALLAQPGEVSQKFLSHLAVIATSPFAPQEASRWLKDILTDATTEQRGHFISEVARCMQNKSPDQQLTIWHAWAKDYMNACCLNFWGVLSPEEFVELAHWPISFEAIGEEVLALTKNLHCHPVKKLDMLRDLKQSNVSANRPDFTAAYLRWLFELPVQATHSPYDLKEIVIQLPLTKSNLQDLQALANRLLHFNFTVEGDSLLERVNAFRKT